MLLSSRGFKGIWTAALLSAVLALSACNGSSSNDGISSAGGSGGSAGTGGSGGAGGDSAFTRVQGPLDPVQEALSGVVADQVGGALPDPLGPTVQCADTAVTSLTDVPDALLVAFAALPGGADPASAFQAAANQMVAALQDFAGRLQSSLRILAGQSNTCSAGTVGGNPFAGTPLEPVGAPLAALIAALQGVGSNPSPAVLAAAIVPLLQQLDAAFAMLPPEVTGAPVVGGLIDTLQAVLGDVGSLLVAAGATDPVAAQAAIKALIDDVLTGVLLGVLPVGEIDAASPAGVPDIAPQIQAGIDQLNAALGTALGTLIASGFVDQLPDVAALISDPTTGLMALLGASGNPLDGILGAVAGGGVSPLDSLLALLMAGAGGVTLDDLAGGLPSGGTGTPVDDLIDVVSGGGSLDSLLGTASLLNGLGIPLAQILATLLGLL